MKKVIRNTVYMTLWVLLMTALGACNKEDNILEIFTGKVWKLSYIAPDGSNLMFDYWGDNDAAYQSSINALRRENTFTIKFEGVGEGEFITGTFNGRIINSNIDGYWHADGKTRSFTTSDVSQSLQETDVLARAFSTGLHNAFRYEGDSDNLFIYFKDGETIKRMGFTPVR